MTQCIKTVIRAIKQLISLHRMHYISYGHKIFTVVCFKYFSLEDNTVISNRIQECNKTYYAKTPKNIF
jgi:hypothetical protein